MLYSLKIYQFKAKEALKDLVVLGFNHIKQGNITNKTITFKSPTGSGKTFILSSLIEDLNEELERERYCVIWACPGKGDLHIQSYDAVNKYLCGNPACSLLENDFFGSRDFIKNKEIVFVNWEKLVMKDRETGTWANNLMKDQEGQRFIDVLDNTRKKGIKVLLVVDESHIGSGNNARTRVNEFRQTIIVPDITIEMSATPANPPDVSVNPQDVIDEGMIKKGVIVNEGISKEDRSLEEKDSEQLILEKGFSKRTELINKFKELNINVNPLVLIQIPNTEAGEAKKEVVRNFLSEREISEANGKLKFWCDNEMNFDKKIIKQNDDVTEFLVFKTAVATGWDCPRAHILIKFREGHSETFEIQTLGRILRTPEARSYDDELLDNAYIFTNIKEFETKQDEYNPNRIKTAFTKMRKGFNRINTYAQTALQSYYRSRQGDYNSADSRFYKYFLKSFMEYFNLNDKDKFIHTDAVRKKFEDKNLDLKVSSNDELISETEIHSSDADNERKLPTDSAVVSMSEIDAESKYYGLIAENLNGLAYARSKSAVNTAITDCFSTFYNIFPRNIKIRCFQRIVINNTKQFAQIISDATREFRDMIKDDAGKTGVVYEFYIEESRHYSEDTHCILSSIKSLYNPLYVLKNKKGLPDNGLEKDFLYFLDAEECVDWYWENGMEQMRINFGIPYNNGLNTFQPDFIVRFNNNSVGIFDTKPIGERKDDTKAKAEALHEYISHMNSGRGRLPKIIGGIIVKSGSQFMINRARIYKDYDDDKTDWTNFNDIIFAINEEIKANKLKK